MEYSRVERCLIDMDDDDVSVMHWWMDNVDSGDIKYENGIVERGKRFAVLGSPTERDIDDFKKYFGTVVQTRAVRSLEGVSAGVSAGASAGSCAGASAASEPEEAVILVPWDLRAPW